MTNEELRQEPHATTLTQIPEAPPSPLFVWYARDGDMSVKDMATRHLFHTLLMIWNHWAPEPLRFEPYRRYRFGAKYTPEYLREAVRAMAPELARRGDLTPEQCETLAQMQARALKTPELAPCP